MPAMSRRQAEVVGMLRHPDIKHVFIPGPVRSGKSWSMVRGFADWASTHFTGSQFFLVAKTASLIRSILVAELNQWAAERNTTVTKRFTDYVIPSSLGGHNTFTPVPMGGGDTAVARVQGTTIGGAIVTEATKAHRDFALELQMRASPPEAKIMWDCNPEGPLHWFRTDWILKERELRGMHMPFTIDDNPTLSEQYKADLRNTLTGPQLQRRYYGRWVSATGMVYGDEFAAAIGTPPSGPPAITVVACDYAASSVTHALLMALYGHTWWIVDECRIDNAGEPTSSRSQAAKLIRWALGHGHTKLRIWIIDPAAADLVGALRELGQRRVELGWNHRLNGIRATQHALGARRLRINRTCQHLIREGGNYAWDEDAAKRGEDDAQDGDDHGMDAMRYGVATIGVLRKQGRFPWAATTDGISDMLLDLFDDEEEEDDPLWRPSRRFARV